MAHEKTHTTHKNIHTGSPNGKPWSMNWAQSFVNLLPQSYIGLADQFNKVEPVATDMEILHSKYAGSWHQRRIKRIEKLLAERRYTTCKPGLPADDDQDGL
jgi:hypothetical protein